MEYLSIRSKFSTVNESTDCKLEGVYLDRYHQDTTVYMSIGLMNSDNEEENTLENDTENNNEE